MRSFITIILTTFSVTIASAQNNKVQIPVPGATGILTIDAVDSSIEIKGYTGDQIEFEPIPEDKSKRTPVDLVFDVSRSKDHITISTNKRRSKGIKAVLKVPSQYSVNVKTIYGESVSIDNINGDISVYAHAGNISLTGVSGSLDLYSANGQITVDATSLSTTVPSIITNVYGDIKLILPSSVKATLEINSNSKKMNTEFELKQLVHESTAANDLQQHAESLKNSESSSDDKQKAIDYILNYNSSVGKTINGGGPIVNLKLHSGTLSIVKSRK